MGVKHVAEHPVVELVHESVVDRVRAGRPHRDGVVDHLADLRPRRHRRHEQGLDRCRRHGERVAGVEHAVIDQVADVRDDRDERVDHRVLVAEGLDREAGGLERLVRPDRRHLVPELAERPSPRPVARTSCRRGVVAQRLGDPLTVEVVGVLVGDQDGVRAVQRRIEVGEHARVDHQRAIAVVEADARVPELGQLHRAGSGFVVGDGIAVAGEQRDILAGEQRVVLVDMNRGFLGTGGISVATDVGRDLVALGVRAGALRPARPADRRAAPRRRRRGRPR